MLSFPFSFKIQFRQFYKSCLKNTQSRSQESLSFWLHNSSVHRAVVVESLNSPILIYPDRLTHYLPRITLTCCADTTSNFSGLRSSIHDYCICMLHREFFFFSLQSSQERRGSPSSLQVKKRGTDTWNLTYAASQLSNMLWHCLHFTSSVTDSCCRLGAVHRYTWGLPGVSNWAPHKMGSKYSVWQVNVINWLARNSTKLHGKGSNKMQFLQTKSLRRYCQTFPSPAVPRVLSHLQ